MSGKYLLDTNIVIALFAEDQSVQKHIAKAGEIFIPSTVIGELFFGDFKSGRPKENTARSLGVRSQLLTGLGDQVLQILHYNILF